MNVQPKRDDLIDIKVLTDLDGSHVDGRNGMFHIQQLYVWESVDHTHVYLEGIGKRGYAIRGGLLVSMDCFAETCRQFLRELERRQRAPACDAAELLPGHLGDRGGQATADIVQTIQDIAERRAQPSDEEVSYPREDKCEVCGKHIGWIMNPAGEALGLGRCDDHPRADGNYEDTASCVKSGRHLKSVDADGYCNNCGYQDKEQGGDPIGVFEVWNMRCPQCCSDEGIEIVGSLWMLLTPDGTDPYAASDGSHEWTPESPARCRRCDFSGTVLDFEIVTTDEERSNGPKKG